MRYKYTGMIKLSLADLSGLADLAEEEEGYHDNFKKIKMEKIIFKGQ